MKKILLINALMFLSLSSMAANVVKTIHVRCETPAQMAGGKNIKLEGNVLIVVSPTTGMTKVESGTKMRLTVGSVQNEIIFGGSYIKLSTKEYIDGFVDSDIRDYSTVMINLKDTPTKVQSFIETLSGKKLVMNCGKK